MYCQLCTVHISLHHTPLDKPIVTWHSQPPHLEPCPSTPSSGFLSPSAPNPTIQFNLGDSPLVCLAYREHSWILLSFRVIFWPYLSESDEN